MLAYAANTRPLGRAESPKALVFIVAGHALLLGALFMSKTEIMRNISEPIKVRLVPAPKPPPPKPIDEPATPDRPATSTVDKPTIIVPHPLPVPDLGDGPKVTQFHPEIGTATELPYDPPIVPKADPVRVAARAVTPDELLRPPYPTSKLRAEEEASLRLRLSIDQRGRVVAVDPVGRTDPEFFASARRHILKAWRYKPATEDGMAIATVVEITLKFRLDQA
jgi:protein TonB